MKCIRITVATLSALLVSTATGMAATPAQAAVDSARPDAAVAAMPSTTRTVSCTAGGMTGEARLSLSTDGNRWVTTVDSYRITDNGRSKGNVDAWVLGRNFVGQITLDERTDSRDAMIQDGAWHALGTTVDVSALPWGSISQYSGTGVKFIFDKSGSDPRCTASTSSLGTTRTFQGLTEEQHATDRSHELVSCRAETDDQVCSIAQTTATSSTVTIGASINPTGGYLEWLTGNISQSWTASRSVDVRCTSPEMSAGQRFVAYPLGTRTTFTVHFSGFGVQIAAPGSSFEVDGGIACAIV